MWLFVLLPSWMLFNWCYINRLYQWSWWVKYDLKQYDRMMTNLISKTSYCLIGLILEVTDYLNTYSLICMVNFRLCCYVSWVKTTEQLNFCRLERHILFSEHIQPSQLTFSQYNTLHLGNNKFLQCVSQVLYEVITHPHTAAVCEHCCSKTQTISLQYELFKIDDHTFLNHTKFANMVSLSQSSEPTDDCNRVSQVKWRETPVGVVSF